MKPCPCTRERRNVDSLVGPACWKALPLELRQRWLNARDRREKRAVAREVIAVARARRPKKQPKFTQAQLL